jgi:hypothetical protein
MINLKHALTDPSRVFNTPQDVLLDNDLTRSQKIDILNRWASEIRDIEVAEEENMQGNNYLDILETILSSLRTLDATVDLEHTPPTKQGG